MSRTVARNVFYEVVTFDYNSMFARLGMDYKIRSQCFFAILEAMTTG